MKNIRIDGIDYPLNTPAEIDAAQRAHARAEEKRDAEAKAAKVALDKLEARADAAEAKVKDLEKKLAEATDPKRLDAQVSARLAVVSKARAIVGEDAKLDGTDIEIMKRVLAHVDPDLKLDGRSDAYIEGRFDALEVEDRSDDEDDLADVRRVGSRLDVSEADEPRRSRARRVEDEDEDDDDPRATMLEEHRDMWKQPLAASKQKRAS